MVTIFDYPAVMPNASSMVTNQFDKRYHKTNKIVENILRKKGYTLHSDIGCGSKGSGKNVVGHFCFGTSNYYLTISIGYNHGGAFGETWPKSFRSNIVRYTPPPAGSGVSPSIGYYYDLPELDFERYQPNEYYDQIIIEEAQQLPRCSELKLKHIETRADTVKKRNAKKRRKSKTHNAR